MTNEVIVRDHSIRELIPIEPMSYDDAVREALTRTARGEAGRLVTARRATGPGAA